jgi:antitoxin component of MazEF toxin-antitoxin module
MLARAYEPKYNKIKYGGDMTVTVKKIGGSMAVIIPRTLAGAMELTEGTSLQISSNAEGILLRKQGSRPRRSLSMLVAQIKPASYRRRNREFSNDGPVGREIW